MGRLWYVMGDWKLSNDECQAFRVLGVLANLDCVHTKQDSQGHTSDCCVLLRQVGLRLSFETLTTHTHTDAHSYSHSHFNFSVMIHYLQTASRGNTAWGANHCLTKCPFPLTWQLNKCKATRCRQWFLPYLLSTVRFSAGLQTSHSALWEMHTHINSSWSVQLML